MSARGAGLELEGAPPFAPWSEALRELVAAAPLPPAEAAWPSELARLCPTVETAWNRRPPGPAGAPDLERARLFEAVVGLVAWCAADAPLLLVLEDMHLADAASLALLAYVGRRMPELDALAAVSRRDSVVNAELEVALEGLRRRGAVAAELRLGPLSPAAVREVVAAAAPALAAADAGRAAAAAEGNPLLARAAARSLAAGDDPADGLRAAVRGPLAGLTVTARLAVDLAAAAARPLAAAELAGPVGAEALPDAVAAGVAADLLAPGADDRIRFRHALIRAACYAELPAGRRAWLHAALAGALGARTGRAPAEVARHLRLAGDDAGARRELAAAAAEARALGALDEAAGFLREAAGLAAGEPAAQAELWLELAGVEAWRGRRAEWDEAFARAEALLAGDARGLAEAHALRGRWLRTTLCYPREALGAYARSLALIDDEGLDAPELRALALAGSAWAEAMAGDPERVEDLAAGAAGVPETAGDRVLAAEIALARAAALVRRGRMEEAEEPYAEAAALAEAAGRPDLAHIAWANVASAAACRGEFGRALALAERAGEGEADRRAGPALGGMVQAARAHALSRLGRHAEAEAAAEAAAALAARSGDPAREASAAFDRGAVALAAGRPAAAVRHLAAALEGPARGTPRPLARLLLAEARLAAEGPDAADDELERMPFEPVGAADLPDTLVARLARLQGCVALARGDAELALRRLGEAERGWRRRLAPAALRRPLRGDAGRPGAAAGGRAGRAGRRARAHPGRPGRGAAGARARRGGGGGRGRGHGARRGAPVRRLPGAPGRRAREGEVGHAGIHRGGDLPRAGRGGLEAALRPRALHGLVDRHRARRRRRGRRDPLRPGRAGHRLADGDRLERVGRAGDDLLRPQRHRLRLDAQPAPAGVRGEPARRDPRGAGRQAGGPDARHAVGLRPARQPRRARGRGLRSPRRRRAAVLG